MIKAVNSRATQWLSKGLAALMLERVHTASADLDFDLIIVGSGYGGSAAAQVLSNRQDTDGRPLRVALLERGREYLKGSFPSRMADLPGHVRFSTPNSAAVSGRREGLFDFRLGPDMCVTLANGLGGGSLINAGVMEPARAGVFKGSAWPKSLRDDPAQMQAWFDAASRALGATDALGRPNTIDRLASYAPHRASFLGQLGSPAAPQRLVPITVALDEHPVSPAGLQLDRCIACGDCATGCNFGAKQSLDTNLLVQAWQNQVEIVTGATVLRVERDEMQQCWRVIVNHTDEHLRARQVEPFVLKARRVVLAAGTLGSTEILMRSRHAGLSLSDRLGQGFSGNGDIIAAAVHAPRPLKAIADEDEAPRHRQVGPTITAMLDAREDQDFVVQDLAVPGPMRWAFEETFALEHVMDGLSRADQSEHTGDVSFDDPYSVLRRHTEHTLPVAIIGTDRGIGVLTQPTSNGELPEEGTLGVSWPGARDDVRVAERQQWLQDQLAPHGGRLLANPLWRLLPSELNFLLDNQLGPMISVHPLGGCAMGDDASHGVVNEWGQVFSGTAGAEVYEGLVVLDGSIVPTSLGINPALTITALALRALDGLQRQWGLQTRAFNGRPPGPRPVFKHVPDDLAAPVRPTMAEFRERMGGFVRMPGVTGSDVKYLELTFVYEPKALKDLLHAGPQRRLRIAPDSVESRLRVFEAQPDPQLPGQYMVVKAGSAAGEGKLWMHAERPDADALVVLPLASAELVIFQREASGPLRRVLRTLWPWFRNRGWRDAMQGLFALGSGSVAPQIDPPGFFSNIGTLLKALYRVLTQAGQLRLMRYEVRVGETGSGAQGDAALARMLATLRFQGVKRITYAKRANPWVQMSRMSLLASGFKAPGGGAAVLDLDLFYLARQQQPLLRITSAQDLPSSARDVASLMAFIARMALGVHALTFKNPDPAVPRTFNRLAGDVPGLPKPEVIEIATGRKGDAGASRQPVRRHRAADADEPVMLRLTRYCGSRPDAPAVLVIHGYSASSTTFAHPSVQPGPAKLLWDAGWDVWLLDMRTSAGMPTAMLPWTFEEAALNDIPVAATHVLQATGQAQIDVFAHCMGSVMFHMAMLEPEAQPFEHFYAQRQKLMQGDVVRKLVISQVTPKMIMSPTNTLRAFFMQYIRPLVPMENYAFRPADPRGLTDRMLDRVLSSLPYPDAEYDIENPFPSLRRTPWTATRHRMDLLYGRDFAITNVDQSVFDFIDDHFGPLSIDTVAQAVHFAQTNEGTDWRGASRYMDDAGRLAAMLQRFPVMSIHGEDNGLCVAESGELLKDFYEQIAPGRYRYLIVPGHGHQDCLIGRDIAKLVFPEVIKFLKEGL